MKTTTLAAVFVPLAAVALAADPPEPPKGPALDTSFLKQYAETRGFTLGRPQKPKITPDGKAVLFLRAEAKTPKLKLYEFDVATGQTKELLSSEALLKGADENLTPEEKARRERQRVTVGGFTDFHLDPEGKRVLVKLSNKLYVFERATGKATELKTGEGGAVVDPKWSPDGKLIAYVRGYDVYAYDLAAGKEWAVTTGGTRVKTHGLAEFVAQEEMHRHSGFWWSPDSKSIAYAEADHTGVEQWHIADPFKPGTEPTPQFYPRPGGKNVAVRLGVIPVTGGETKWIDWDREKYEYLAHVSWDPRWSGAADPKVQAKPGPLTIILQDRGQHELTLLAVEATTGGVKPLVVEKDAAWVNIPVGMPMRTDDRFLWLAQVDGRLEVQERDDNGKLQGVVVPGKENVVEVIRTYRHARGGTSFEPFHGHGRMVAYHVAPDPTQKQVRVTSIGAWFITPGSETAGHLTTEPGVHTGTFCGHDTPIVITSTTLKQMPRSAVFSIKHTKTGELPSVAAEPPFQPNVSIQKVGDYWTGIVRPKDFDPKKKYPVVVSVYGGPTSLVVTQAMQPWLIRQWLADQGFVVVAIDNRGTPGRGRDWEKAVYQKFGTVPLEDQVKGLHALCEKFPELDRERVGVVGWSFGGYMAANGVLRRPDVFKAAVAGAPVSDWEDYDTHYTERYMGLLPESKAAYDEASLIPLAKDLKRPLLLVHGTADDNVYFRHTLKLTDALFRAGREFEVLPLPGVTHMYTSDPVVMERLWAKTATFFKQHLGEPK
jgi:dipeptidyl-peptidase-4